MIPKQLFSNSENISFIYFTLKMTNNLPNTWNSEKNIERIITAARGYDKWHIEEKDIAWILQDYSSNDWDRIKKTS